MPFLSWEFQISVHLWEPPSSTPTPRTPQFGPWSELSFPRNSDYGLSFSFPCEIQSLGWSEFWSEFFARTMVWVSSREARNTITTTPSRTIPKTQPLQVAFSLLERVDLRCQKQGILGKKIAWGRVGWTGQKKEKRMRQRINANYFCTKFFDNPSGRKKTAFWDDFPLCITSPVGARDRYHLSFWRFFPCFIVLVAPIWGQSM